MKSFTSITYRLKVVVNICTIIFSILMIADIIMEYEVSEEFVKYKLNTVRSAGGLQSRQSVSVIGFETNVETYVLKEPSVFINVKKGDYITLYKSQIFSEIEKIEHDGKIYNDPTYSAYALNYLFPIICIVSSFGAMMFVRSRTPLFELLLSVSAFMTGYIIVSMFTNNVF